MKNKILFIISLFFMTEPLIAQNIKIESEIISLDKKRELSIFQNNVIIRTNDNNVIKSQYAEYNKKDKKIILKTNVIARDNHGNLIETSYAEYDEIKELFISKGMTKITTPQKFIVNGKNIIFDNKKRIIKSDSQAILNDIDNNEIKLSNFEYQNSNNIFKSIGKTKILDKFGNSYELSQLYIDSKKKEFIGTDIKAFINNDEFKLDKDNKPRIFANTINIQNEKIEFKKAVFTNCNYRKNDKCPPWSIKSSKIIQDNKKKTIYYDNAVVKIYDIPVFYFPKFSHPDPSVKRRSGFLNPSFLNSANLGRSVRIPYFYAIDNDKDFTLKTVLFSSENPLYLGEYRQAFKNSYALLDFGFTEGYKKTSNAKTEGDKSHIFSNLLHNFSGKKGSKNSLELKLQEVSDDKYFKLYNVKTKLINQDMNTIEKSIDFNHEKEDFYFNATAGVYETLQGNYNDKYEYIFPEINLRKNLINDEKIGNLDIASNLKILNEETNKTSKFLVNDLDWDIKSFTFNSGLKTKLLAKFKNINYESKNVKNYKKDPTYELFSAFGYLTEIDLIKETNQSTKHYLKPKILAKYSPGQMKKDSEANRLNISDVFSLNRSSKNENFETGLNFGFGFDYEIEGIEKNFKLSMGQVISEKENKKMSSISSLDEKISDLVGDASLEINKNIELNYNFLIDQNYQDFNYNEIGAKVDFDIFNFELDYMQERKHVGKSDYALAKIGIKNGENTELSFQTKRNFITNSSEYYDLSYQYFNDCLRAGIGYRREFYRDSELEPEDTLFFRISIIPDGNDNDQLLN